MSAIGTTLGLWKSAVIAELKSRPALTSVNVQYSYPEDNITNEDIWFDEAESDNHIPLMKAGVKRVEEEYVASVVIQVLKSQGETQEVADIRAIEIFAELQQALAEVPQTIPEILWAELIGWRHAVGVLPSSNGHGSRFTCLVRVRARLFPMGG